MSVSRRMRMAWVSGSPKRVLNSRTMGPRAGHHDAAEEDAHEGRVFGAHAVDDFLRDVDGEPVAHELGVSSASVE